MLLIYIQNNAAKTNRSKKIVRRIRCRCSASLCWHQLSISACLTCVTRCLNVNDCPWFCFSLFQELLLKTTLVVFFLLHFYLCNNSALQTRNYLIFHNKKYRIWSSILYIDLKIYSVNSLQPCTTSNTIQYKAI